MEVDWREGVTAKRKSKNYALQIAEELDSDIPEPHNMTRMHGQFGSLLSKIFREVRNLEAEHVFLTADIRAYEQWHDKVISSAKRELQRLHQENADLRLLLNQTKKLLAKHESGVKK